MENRNITGATDFVTDWLEVCIAGTYQQMAWCDEGPYIKEVQITTERLQRLVANFKPELREPVVMEGHYPYNQKALAWVVDVKLDGNVFMSKLKDLSPTFRTIIANKEYKYFSIGTDFMDKADETTEYFEHLACTNFPLVPGMKSFPDAVTGIAASRNVVNVFTSKINFESFSKGLSAESSPENLKEKKSMLDKIKLIASRIGVTLPANVDEAAALELCTAGCEKLAAENSQLKTDLDAAKLQASNAVKSLNDTIIASAVDSGRITEAEKPTFEKLLADSPETTKELLATKQPSGIFAANTVKNPIDASNKTGDAGRESWTYRDWETKDPQGLKAMMQKDRTKFDRLFASQYGDGSQYEPSKED